MSHRNRLWPLAIAAALSSACSATTGSSVPEGADEKRPDDAAMHLVSFDDVAAEVGLVFRHSAFRWGPTGDPAAMMGGGLCWIDYDNNGWLDLFVVNTWSEGEYGRWAGQGGPPTSHLFANEDGQFTDVTDQVDAGHAVRGNGCVAADLDADGWTDLFVTTDRENLLLWNNAGQRFTKGAAAAGVGHYGWHAGAAVGDVNGDNRLDVVVTGYADTNRPIPEATRGFPNSFEPEPDLLLLNQGAPADGGRPTFRDVAGDVGLEPAGLEYGLGAVLSDVDRDGDLDLFVANDTNPNRLYENRTTDDRHAMAFVDRSEAAGVDDDNAGMGIASGDYDANGLPDLLVTNMGDQLHNVFRNGGEPGAGQFRYRSALDEMGLSDLGVGLTGWGTAWVDVDLDSDLDLVIAHGAIPVKDLAADREPLQVFQNRSAEGKPGRFVDASTTVGLDQVNYLARGLAAADYDNDGDIDLAIGTIGGDIGLLRNSGAGGHWLTVAPDPPVPGTVVTVTSSSGSVQQRELLAGSSYLSSEDHRLHFGLGGNDDELIVRVDWPDGRFTEKDEVDADQFLFVRPT